jgi:hypothetical protein
VKILDHQRKTLDYLRTYGAHAWKGYRENFPKCTPAERRAMYIGPACSLAFVTTLVYGVVGVFGELAAKGLLGTMLIGLFGVLFLYSIELTAIVTVGFVAHGAIHGFESSPFDPNEDE